MGSALSLPERVFQSYSAPGEAWHLSKPVLYGLAGAAAILLLAGFIGGLLIRRALLSEVHRIRRQ
jgi:hypothetical protein